MRACAYCGQEYDGSDGWGGPDPCLGLLPGVISACCGHGVNRPYRPYVWREDGRAYAVAEAIEVMRQLGGDPPDVPQPRMIGTVPRRLSDVSRSRA